MCERTRLHVPMRTCVGCHESAPQEELIRLKLVGARIVIARSDATIPGRSIYFCPQESCWRAALKRNSLAFKTSKHDRVVVRLGAHECDQLTHRLRAYVREERRRN